MDNSQIWKIVFDVIAGVGGIGVIILAIIKFSSDFIAEKLATKYEHKLDAKLEKYKSELSKKEYVSKTKFDAEFTLYRELSKVFFDAIKAVSIMIPYGMTKVSADEEKRKEEEEYSYQEALKAVVLAQDTLRSNIPFISKEIYELYADILSDCNTQLDAFSERWNKSFLGHKFGESTLTHEDYKRTKTITEKFNALNEKVREYISKLDVMD